MQPGTKTAAGIIGSCIVLAVLALVLVLALQHPGKRPDGARQDHPEHDDHSKHDPAQASSDVPVVGDSIWREYDENAAAADLKYQGRWTKIKGRISQIDTDSIGFGVIEAIPVSPGAYQRKTAREKRWFNEGYPANIVCRFEKGRRSEIATVKKNTVIFVVGRVVGRQKDSEVWMGYKIVLEDCRLASP